MTKQMSKGFELINRDTQVFQDPQRVTYSKNDRFNNSRTSMTSVRYNPVIKTPPPWPNSKASPQSNNYESPDDLSSAKFAITKICIQFKYPIPFDQSLHGSNESASNPENRTYIACKPGPYLTIINYPPTAALKFICDMPNNFPQKKVFPQNVAFVIEPQHIDHIGLNLVTTNNLKYQNQLMPSSIPRVYNKAWTYFALDVYLQPNFQSDLNICRKNPMLKFKIGIKLPTSKSNYMIRIITSFTERWVSCGKIQPAPSVISNLSVLPASDANADSTTNEGSDQMQQITEDNESQDEPIARPKPNTESKTSTEIAPASFYGKYAWKSQDLTNVYNHRKSLRNNEHASAYRYATRGNTVSQNPINIHGKDQRTADIEGTIDLSGASDEGGPSSSENSIDGHTHYKDKRIISPSKRRRSNKLLIYRPHVSSICPKTSPPSLDSIEITLNDLTCLKPREYLNDVIIDFYLKYLWCERIPLKLQNAIYMFNTFFYARLTSNIPPRDHDNVKNKKHTIRKNLNSENKDPRVCATPIITSSLAQHKGRISQTENKCHSSKCVDPFELSRKLYDTFLTKYHQTISNDKYVSSTMKSSTEGANSTLSSTKQSNTEIPSNGTSTNLENDLSLPLSAKYTLNPVTEYDPLGPLLHANVKKWTKGVDLFERQYIVIPVNEASHWYVVIICLPPNLVNRVSNYLTDGQAWWVDEPEYRPIFIVVFDSLFEFRYGPLPRYLRAYLNEEWLSKHPNLQPNLGRQRVLFNKDTVKTLYPRVPQQSNSIDCGVYLLHYVETFFAHLPDWHGIDGPGLPQLKRYFIRAPGWKFDDTVGRSKRRAISELIIKLSNKSSQKCSFSKVGQN